MPGYTPYYAPYNYPMYPRFDQPQYPPQNGPQNAVGAPQGQGGITTSPNAQTGFLCRPVTSRQEAEVYQIPFDGSTAYFVDTSSGNLYSKTFDFSTGTAPLVTYVRETPPPAVQYATVEQLSAVLEEIERLKKPAGKGGKKNEPEPDE